MISSVVKVALIAGVAGAVVLSTGATAIAATREDPGVMVVSVTADDDDPDKATTPKKGSKGGEVKSKGKAKAKKKAKVGGDDMYQSYAMYSASGPSETEELENVARASRGDDGRLPAGRMELARDLLAGSRR